jgi:hypothetical protein
MPDLLLFVPSESCSIDSSSNRVSIFHICEQLNLVAFPGLVPCVYFSTLWQKLPNEGPNDVFMQTIELADPDGSSLCRTSAKFSMTRRRHRLISIVSNVQIHRAGMHYIRLFLHGEREEPAEHNLIKQFPLEVQQVPRTAQ